jgi:DNA-binding transcriptional MerR regulator
VRSKVSRTQPMHSSELARLAGVSTDTLRYYERFRLLPTAPRSAAGYRLFPAQALDRVRLIRGALANGFSVRELTTIFAERDRGGSPCCRLRGIPFKNCQRVLVLAREKLAAVETSLRDLQVWRRELKTTLAGWERQLRKTPLGQRAGLLETFVASHPNRRTRCSSGMPLARGHQKSRKSQ